MNFIICLQLQIRKSVTFVLIVEHERVEVMTRWLGFDQIFNFAYFLNKKMRKIYRRDIDCLNLPCICMEKSEVVA